jgi:hypothetical protein
LQRRARAYRLDLGWLSSYLDSARLLPSRVMEYRVIPPTFAGAPVGAAAAAHANHPRRIERVEPVLSPAGRGTGGLLASVLTVKDFESYLRSFPSLERTSFYSLGEPFRKTNLLQLISMAAQTRHRDRIGLCSTHGHS